MLVRLRRISLRRWVVMVTLFCALFVAVIDSLNRILDDSEDPKLDFSCLFKGDLPLPALFSSTPPGTPLSVVISRYSLDSGSLTVVNGLSCYEILPLDGPFASVQFYFRKVTRDPVIYCIDFAFRDTATAAAIKDVALKAFGIEGAHGTFFGALVWENSHGFKITITSKYFKIEKVNTVSLLKPNSTLVISI